MRNWLTLKARHLSETPQEVPLHDGTYGSKEERAIDRGRVSEKMKQATNSVVRVLRTQSYAYSAWPLPSIWASKMYAVCSFQKQLEEPHVLIVMGVGRREA
jgi:hypothetical protein